MAFDRHRYNIPWHILLTLVTSFGTVSSLYFPMSDLQLVAPPLRPTILLRVTARQNSGNESQNNTKYKVVDNPGWVVMDSASNTLRLTGEQKELVSEEVKITARDKSKNSARMKVNVTILSSTDMRSLCEENRQALCFWPGVQYQVYENSIPTLLGPLGPSYLQELCPEYIISYQLISSHDFVQILDGSLWSKENLDRDTTQKTRSENDTREINLSGPIVEVQVQCSVKRGGDVSTYNTTVNVTVLDVNDNTPRPNTETPKTVYLDNQGFIPKDYVLERVAFMDKDTEEVNVHQASILEDEMKLWRIDCNDAGHVNMEGFNDSASYCTLRANYDKQLDPKKTYRLVVQMNDTTMVQGDKPSHVNVTWLLNMGPKPPPPPTPPPPPSVPLYPRNVSLLRHAQTPVRVLQPSQRPYLTTMYSRLAAGSPIFGITSRAGIVYVQNKTVLLEAPQYVQLGIEWRYKKNEPWKRVNVTVMVEEGIAPACQHDKEVTKVLWCSKKENKTDCINHCGIGTGKGNFTSHGLRENISDITQTGGCAWRDPKNYRGDLLTERYSTCTPDLETCPDKVCDPLEEIFPALCQQDCVDSNKVFGMPFKPPTKGRGIIRGHGVCTCGALTCSCHERIESTKLTTAAPSTTTTPESSGPSTKKADLRGSCGAECKLGVVVGSLLLIGSTIGFIFWRYRLAGKGRRDRKFMGSVASLSVVHSDYVDRSLQATDVQGLTSPRASPDPRTTPDPKWEFPRSRLVIEQTLGEGEFGRVLRARAMDIGGTTGYTTVAVKTLKEDASASELADLLSEYQLLKEVSHPNVVRLLGACTAPGAPVYLIIEFAEHGSLRNYLRKSRHLESDGQIPCSFEPTAHPEDMPPAPSPATPRDILCFAWQISKGMAYLSDIKLVHRDLAARNVLVGAGKVCKISDFGLTRDVYEDDAYLKRSKGRVPVKWMALESLADHMYTSKSDVWSFGVLMWELVTLGASPYPGVAVHNLFHLLRAGYRMERPENCSSQLYRVMRSCWNEDASDRPSFKELTRIFERMLEDGVEYLDLNPRIVHNRTYFTSLSSSQDILDDDDLGYGNLNILPTDSVNYLTHQRQLQSSSSRMPLLSTGDEEQRLLTPPVDSNKISSQTDSEKQEESPRIGNAYLSPIRQPSSLNRISNDSSVVNPSSASLSQAYINMTVGQPKRGSSQDLLVSTSPVTSKVTTPF